MPENIDIMQTIVQLVFTIISLLWDLLLYALIGKAAAVLTKVAKGGIIKYIAIGVIGSALGSFIADFLGLGINGTLAGPAVAIAGACLFVVLGRKLTSKTK